MPACRRDADNRTYCTRDHKGKYYGTHAPGYRIGREAA